MGNTSRFNSSNKQPAASSSALVLQQQQHPTHSLQGPDRGTRRAMLASAVAQGRQQQAGEAAHGFWLQQHYWLHQSAHSEAPSAEVQASPMRQKRQCLLARHWTNLKRSFGGSTQEVGNVADQHQAVGCTQAAPPSLSAHSTLSKPSAWSSGGQSQRKWRRWAEISVSPVKQQKQKAREQQPSATASKQPAGSEGRLFGGEQKRRRGWFMKSLSSSTSALLGAGSKQQQQQHTHLAPPTTSDFTTDERGQSEHPAIGSAPQAAPSSTPVGAKRQQSSPYRQIARAFASRSPCRKLAPTQRAAKQPSQAAGGSLLGNIFVSPIFRRRTGALFSASNANAGLVGEAAEEDEEARRDAEKVAGENEAHSHSSPLSRQRKAFRQMEKSIGRLDKELKQASSLAASTSSAKKTSGKIRDEPQLVCAPEQQEGREAEVDGVSKLNEAPKPRQQLGHEQTSARPEVEPLHAVAASKQRPSPNLPSDTHGNPFKVVKEVEANGGLERAVTVGGGSNDAESYYANEAPFEEKLGPSDVASWPRKRCVGGQTNVADIQAGAVRLSDETSLLEPEASRSPHQSSSSTKHTNAKAAASSHETSTTPTLAQAHALASAQADRQAAAESQLLPLIQPLASSSSSLSSICYLDLSSQPALDNDNSASNNFSNNNNDNNSGSGGDSDEADDSREEPRGVVKISIGMGGSGADSERPQSQPAGSSEEQKQQQQAVGRLTSNFKKLVKRQQSVDSYRMARELKNKQRRQQETRDKHQSNEAIKTGPAGDSSPSRAQPVAARRQQRKFSMAAPEASAVMNPPLKILIDPYAKPGSFTLPGADSARANEDPASQSNRSALSTNKSRAGIGKGPTPPNTLSLLPSPQQQHPGAFVVGSFSGCITPTYPTHHLPSPKYVSPSASAAAGPASGKKYSNASTISSSFGADNSPFGAAAASQCAPAASASPIGPQTGLSFRSIEAGANCGGVSVVSIQQQTLRSDTDSASLSHSTAIRFGSVSGAAGAPQAPEAAEAAAAAEEALARKEAAAEAARRANLAEHIYDNKCGLGEDMKFLASLPELCDITFLVGETREPVCAVKSVLAARSRVFHKILFGDRIRRFASQQRQRQQQESLDQQQPPEQAGSEISRRGSSPRPASQQRAALANKSSSPLQQRSSSPGHQQWSVTSDASGYNPASCSPAPKEDSAASRSGRTSVASTTGGRVLDSGSQSSQQPLIIGPGQTATPAPPSKRNKKGLVRDIGIGSSALASGGAANLAGNLTTGAAAVAQAGALAPAAATTTVSTGATARLSRMFMKRASDPSIKHNQGSSVAVNHSNHNYLDKMSSSQMSTTMIIEEFEPDVFRQLIEYIHTGCVLLQARTLLGLLNAADYYGLEQLRRACLRFVSCCITVDTVCSLLSTAERYIQYKCTKSIVQKVLEFVDTHADEIFKLNAFGLLPEHVVRLILSRDGLKADELVKYNGVYTWCEHYCRSYELTNISDVMRNFLDLIQFHKIPTNVLLTEIYPTRIVPDNIFLGALAYQAELENAAEPAPARERRMTLPNPTPIYDDDNDNDDDASVNNADNSTNELVQPPDRPRSSQQQRRELPAQPLSSVSFGGFVGGLAAKRRKSSQRASATQSGKLASATAARGQRNNSAGEPFYGSQQMLVNESLQQQQQRSGINKQQPSTSGRAKIGRLRKGSIAQVSISGVIKLSHRLSIKKRHSSNTQAAATFEPVRRRESATSSAALEGGAARRHPAISKQQSAACLDRDPLRLGQQILNAHLARQRQLQLEEAAEEERRRRAEQAAGEAEAGGNNSSNASTKPQENVGSSQELNQQEMLLQQQQQSKSSSSTRKSFKDFKHISRRIFMRRSSSKTLQQQQSACSASGAFSDKPIMMDSAVGGNNSSRQTADKQAGKRRNVLKIKRSKTAYESSTHTVGSSGAQATAGNPLYSRLSHQLSSSQANK